MFGQHFLELKCVYYLSFIMKRESKITRQLISGESSVRNVPNASKESVIY